jgi:hypothetical protein
MSGSSVAAAEGDAEGGQGSAWVAGVAAQRGGEVDRPRPAQHPDNQVAQGRHDMRAAAAADLAGVLGKGDISECDRKEEGLRGLQDPCRGPGALLSRVLILPASVRVSWERCAIRQPRVSAGGWWRSSCVCGG